VRGEITALQYPDAGIHHIRVQLGSTHQTNLGNGLANAQCGAVGRSDDMDSTISATVRMRDSSRMLLPDKPSG
jgi:hypothetical protein